MIKYMHWENGENVVLEYSLLSYSGPLLKK